MSQPITLRIRDALQAGPQSLTALGVAVGQPHLHALNGRLHQLKNRGLVVRECGLWRAVSESRVWCRPHAPAGSIINAVLDLLKSGPLRLCEIQQRLGIPEAGTAWKVCDRLAERRRVVRRDWYYALPEHESRIPPKPSKRRIRVPTGRSNVELIERAMAGMSKDSDNYRRALRTLEQLRSA